MRILIVDDEPLIHVSIEYCLKELSLPDLTIFHAYHGGEMLQNLKDNLIDLALVDIQMPGINGLEGIASAKKLYPQTIYYIMSSYSEFDYAREAVKLGVVEYLMKPLSTEDLRRVLNEARNALAQQKQRLRDDLRNWIAGTVGSHEMSYLFPRDYYTAVILLTYDGSSDTAFWVPDIVNEHSDDIVSLPASDGLILTVYSQNYKWLQSFLRTFPSDGYPQGVTVFTSGLCSDHNLLRSQLLELIRLAPGRVWTGVNRRYALGTMEKPREDQLTSAELWIGWRDAFRQMQYGNYLSVCAQLREQTRSQRLSDRDLEGLKAFVEAVTQHNWNAMTAGDILRDIIPAGSSDLRQSEKGDKLDQILHYIQENFRQDISVANLSEQFQITPNYLSTLLKKRLGMKFTDYLNGLRLSYAKELLISSRLSVREIMEQSGYYSQSYFTRLFLEKEGCTPAEYRTKHQNL